MEVLKLDIIGSFSYKPDFEIITYDKDSSNKYNNNIKECVICKMNLVEPSYEMMCNNKNLLNSTEIVIGKCGHIFHGDCLCTWLKTCDTCPIDKIKWHFERVADTTIKSNLVLYDKPTNRKKKFNKNNTNNTDNTNLNATKYLKNNNGEKINH